MTTVGDAHPMGLAPGGAVAYASEEDARNLRALLEDRGQAIPVTLAMPANADTDVEGHGQGRSLALTLVIGDGDDDTEGHAISVNFPTAEAAARFRRNLLLTGALAGSIVLGSAGAVVITSQLSAPADDASLPRTPVYERPAGHGALEGVDPFSSVSTDAAAPAFVISLTDSGHPAGVDGGLTEASNVNNEPVNRQPGHGPLEGVD